MFTFEFSKCLILNDKSSNFRWDVAVANIIWKTRVLMTIIFSKINSVNVYKAAVTRNLVTPKRLNTKWSMLLLTFPKHLMLYKPKFHVSNTHFTKDEMVYVHVILSQHGDFQFYAFFVTKQTLIEAWSGN